MLECRLVVLGWIRAREGRPNVALLVRGGAPTRAVEGHGAVATPKFHHDDRRTNVEGHVRTIATATAMQHAAQQPKEWQRRLQSPPTPYSHACARSLL